MPFKANCYVKRNHSNRTPKRLICLDTECVQTENNDIPNAKSLHWRCGAASFDRLKEATVTGHERIETDDITEFWQWILTHCHKREVLWVFAHNLIFDLSISDFWRFAASNEVKIDRYVIEDPPSIIDATWNGCKIRMVDSMNYWPVSLAKIGDSIGVRKWDLPGDDADRLHWHNYCRNDVNILREFSLSLIQGVKCYNLGNFQPTIASQSMSAYRHRFMPYPILPHDDLEIAKLERQSYFGGRCYCGYVGEANGPIYHVDVNSLYPAVMQQFQFPVQLLHSHINCSLEMLSQCLSSWYCMANVRLSTLDWEYPYRRNGRVIYPRGIYNAVLCGSELSRALAANSIMSVDRIVAYQCKPIFAAWSDYWFNCISMAREVEDKLGMAFAKLMANSLSGKWAQRPTRWEPIRGVFPERDYAHWFHHDVSTGTWSEYRAVAGCTQIREELEDKCGGLVAISAAITSHARIFMDGCRHIAGNHNVYYQDTDSLLLTSEGYQNLKGKGLIDQSALGKFKVVDVYKRIKIEGPRRWWHDGIMVAPGIKSDAQNVADGVYRQETWQGAKTLLSNDPNGNVIVQEKDITLSPIYLGCSIGEGGWTHPIKVAD